MITPQAMTGAMRALESFNLLVSRQGQSAIWLDMLIEASPNATDDDLVAAVRKMGRERTSDRGGSWITLGDLIAQLRTVRKARIELEESKRQQIGTDNPPASIDFKRLMADARRGVDPVEAVRRARERSERDSMKSKLAEGEA